MYSDQTNKSTSCVYFILRIVKKEGRRIFSSSDQNVHAENSKVKLRSVMTSNSILQVIALSWLHQGRSAVAETVKCSLNAINLRSK